MNDSTAEPVSSRLKAWGQQEIENTEVRWAPEFLRLKASLARQEHRATRVVRLERLGWSLAIACGLIGLLLAWPTQGWTRLLETPSLFMPPLLSLALLGRGLWGSLEA